ncbi:uncharacterized protein LOC125493084 [Beta vulgaris subsp. vulgaris]|uniref:uncharacterized protein LOC125493084 n=1 Tax=Beta vulgaris subsp. vulgaris TaxID=3555 RepID=UPI0025472342|nr:uncharacterized protein LOC125493084 [Beta vulgaris subsp. vulgaris]
MLDAHMRYGGKGTLLVIKVSAESANLFGELVADPDTKELLHYTEKPETFGMLANREDKGSLRRLSSYESFNSATRYELPCL